ncbi:MAG: hypothetical protein P8080_02330 [Gammaproteobacteria bacterium]
MRTPRYSGVWIFLAMLLASGLSPSWAEDDAAVVRCAQIRDDAERLACFDRVARQQREAIETPPPAPAPAAPAQPANSTPPPPPPAPASTADDFGAEQTQAAAAETEDSSKVMRTRIVGYFDGFTGDTELTLENGQVWRQTDSARLPVQETNPAVVIEKGFFGNYRLSVEGFNRSIRVKRVK